MAKTFRTSGAGSQQTLHEIEDEKIPVYDTKADAEADLANLEEGQIVGTKDPGNDYESELYNYVDAKLATTTTEVAMDVFQTGSKAYLNKSGNNVQLRYWVYGDSTSYNPIARETNVRIGTIPEGFRPKQKLVLNSDNNVPNDTNYASTLVTIETDGSIFVWVFGQNPMPANFSINVDYNIDGSNSNFMSVNTLKDAKDYTDEQIYEKIAGIVRVTDCDTMDVPGTYNYDLNTANTPDNFYGVLVVYGSSPDKTPSTNRRWIMQVATNTRGEVYRRQKTQPQSGGTWTAWEEMDAMTYNIIVAQPTGQQPNGYLSQIKYFLNNADWTKVNNSIQYRGEFVGSMELQGCWYGTYHLSNMGVGYKIMNGTIYAEGNPVRFSAWYDPNYSSGWRVSLSYNYTYVDISGQQYIGNLNEQLSTALNLIAPQTWDVQHCDCNIEVLGYFYAMGTYDRRGNVASFSGTILSSNPVINGQSFTAEFEVTRNYWKCHNIILTQTGAATVDGNSNVYLGAIIGTNDCEIIAVRSTNVDMPIIPVKNIAGQWYARATGWDGSSAAGTTVTLEIQFRLL